MEIKIELDESYKDTQIIIRTNKITPHINELMEKLALSPKRVIAGFLGQELELIEVSNIVRFYSSNQKVFASTNSKEYLVRLRLYQIEETLDNTLFIRISNSEIINIRAIKKIDLSFAGTICVVLSSDITTYVSRRYVKKIKKILGI